MKIIQTSKIQNKKIKKIKENQENQEKTKVKNTFQSEN